MISKANLLQEMEKKKSYLTPMQESVIAVIDTYVKLSAQEQQHAVILPESLLFEDVKHLLWMITDVEIFMQDIVTYVTSLGYFVKVRNENNSTLNRFYLAVMWPSGQ